MRDAAPVHRTRPTRPRPAGSLLLAAALAAALAACGDSPSEAPPDARAGAVDAVLDLYRDHDVVALMEAHELQEEADFVAALVRDPRFAARVRTIVVEFGNQRFQDVADRFVIGTPVPDDSLRMIWRNNTTSPLQQWDAPIYEQFFRTVRAANAGLPAASRLRVVLGDPRVEWETVRPPDLLPKVVGRDSSYRAWVEREGLDRGRKVLLIAGGLHLLKHHGPPPPGLDPGALPPTLVEELERKRPGSTYVIMPHTGFGASTDSLESRLALGATQALIPLARHWLGAKDAGIIEDVGTIVGPGGQPVSTLAGRPIGHYADAYLWLGPRRSLTLSTWNPAVYLDPAYVAELDRRNRLRFGRPLDVARLLAPRGPGYHDRGGA